MEMPGRRSSYSLLNQFPDETQAQQTAKFFESVSPEKSKVKPERALDWPIAPSDGGPDPRGRIGSLFPSVGLQRQSSGSSFGESSLSGDYYLPTLSAVANEVECYGAVQDEGFRGGGGDGRLNLGDNSGPGGSSSSKSWAQQTEESYQLQLALALRLSSEATCADDPNFLCPVLDDSGVGPSVASAESMSHRFWVNGCLSYYDKVPDGFYLIHGLDPYVWMICSNPQESGRVPSLESLKAVDLRESSVEVVLVDRQGDPNLRDLENQVVSISSSCITTTQVVEQLAKLVSIQMGGEASSGEASLLPHWKNCCESLKDRLGSLVLPLGSLSVGLCRHRALLFKVLADKIDLPCRIAKGCKYCQRNDASSCLVRFGVDREYLVDLIGNPGFLCEPDSLLNGPSSISISSPLCLPMFKSVRITEDFRSLAKLYFSECQSLNLIFGGDSTGQEDILDASYPNNSEIKCPVPPVEDSEAPRPQAVRDPSRPNDEPQLQRWQNPSQIGSSQPLYMKDSIQAKPLQRTERRDIPPLFALSAQRAVKGKDIRLMESSQVLPTKTDSESALQIDDLDIPWSDLALKERIGAGSFGTVHRADWHGSEVAVKILMDQDIYAERFKEFLREVAIMKRLRHPNIVLFMGAVTQPPNLSIVTEYLSRGSLYRLLHKPGAREVLDERRRLNMAYDVAKGMNYLHKRNPPIVHRDLKSPNLLVDKKYTVKVCDFGLSRFKQNTYLSSKSAAGTPEWMAPEVLRDEPSNEKSDVYSFGIILWELVTLQQPWNNLNPAQVVAAVGFKSRRLEIPSNVNPQVGALIASCWDNDPWKRPSFADIMEALKPLIKLPTPQPVR
ncbi:serine/threonine-protein kinase CTR1-like [Aristolochia californica]|uniref:serine/threonine-protein kinase CTR1-like n=1 Tax=Aristolochia californica TaxID=171875 RepID=UPI0035DA583A